MQKLVIVGDCKEELKKLPYQSVNCCVTSPPYYGLRDYKNKKQIGLEETPEEYVAKLVEVFREVHRVLRDDGTVWLNIGDKYDSKELLGVPWMLAFALRADGWILCQDIIWSKPNPYPASATNRCTPAHEYIFLLSKKRDYYFDYKIIMDKAVLPVTGRSRKFGSGQLKGKPKPEKKEANDFVDNGEARKKSVWTVKVGERLFKNHYAQFPPDLIEPCIKAGCPKGGTVLDPFAGTGTTADVAYHNARGYIMIELNPEYAKAIRKRTTNHNSIFD